jgi:hypothetical protein
VEKHNVHEVSHSQTIEEPLESQMLNHSRLKNSFKFFETESRNFFCVEENSFDILRTQVRLNQTETDDEHEAEIH